jgi:hypothetical protein
VATDQKKSLNDAIKQLVGSIFLLAATRLVPVATHGVTQKSTP